MYKFIATLIIALAPSVTMAGGLDRSSSFNNNQEYQPQSSDNPVVNTMRQMGVNLMNNVNNAANAVDPNNLP